MRFFAFVVLLIGSLNTSAQNADEHVKIGTLLFEHKRYDQAQDHFDQALELNPDHCGAKMMTAGVLHLRGRNHEALQYLNACNPNEEDVALHAYFKGACLRDTGNPADAIDWFNTSIGSMYPARMYSITEIRYHRALAYHDNKQYAEAIADLDICMKMVDYNPKYYWLRAECHLYSKSPDLAIADVNQALAHQPDVLTKSNVLMVRGDAYRQKGDSVTACTDYIEAYNLGNIIAGYRASLCPESPTYEKTIEVAKEEPHKEEPHRVILNPSELSWDHLATEAKDAPVEKTGSCMTGHNQCATLKKVIAAAGNDFTEAKGAILSGEGTGSIVYASTLTFPGARENMIIEMTGFQTVFQVIYMNASDPYDLETSYVDLVELTRGCILLAGHTIREESSDENSHRFYLLHPDYPKDDDYLQAKHGISVSIRKDGDELILSL